MPWNSSFAKHLVLAETQGFVTSAEYAAIRELLTRDEPWRKLEDQSVNWDKPHEPGPIKIVPQSDERALAERDERIYGIGFLIDGKHVDPSRVVILNSKLRSAIAPIDAMAIARIIIGPREPVPVDSKWTLRELQDIRWEETTLQERNNAIWLGNVIIKLLETPSC